MNINESISESSEPLNEFQMRFNNIVKDQQNNIMEMVIEELQ